MLRLQSRPSRSRRRSRIAHLALARLAPQLAHRLDDVAHAEHVCLGEETAVRVDGQRAAELEASALDERPTLAALAEPVSSSCCRTSR